MKYSNIVAMVNEIFIIAVIILMIMILPKSQDKLTFDLSAAIRREVEK